MRTIRVVSRRSQLAMAQTKWTIERLRAAVPAWNFEIVPIVTQGDRIQNVPLSEVGGKGLFVSEVEQAIAQDRGDMTVHSLKDVPADLLPGLVLAGYPERVEPRDALVSRDNLRLEDLPQHARIGTSSLRRAAQLRAKRPDLEIVSIRGNIDTRLHKLESDGLDGVILAAAGLVRMGWDDRISELLAPDICLPAVGQGVLGIECRAGDADLIEALEAITHDPTRVAALAERTFLGRLEGGCQVPIAGYAQVLPTGAVSMTGLVATEDGRRVLRAHAEREDAVSAGRVVAEDLLARGAAEIVAQS